MKSSRILAVLLAVFLVALCCTTESAAAQKVEARSDSGRQNILGNWQGTLVTTAGRLRLVLKISGGGDGKLKATMDSPDQRAPDLAVDSINLTDSFVHFEMEAIGASFDGGLSRDGSEIAGCSDREWSRLLC